MKIIINNCVQLMFKTITIIIGCVSAQTFTSDVIGPTTTPSFVTTTLASILTNNFSYSTPFVPNVTPISFQHTDAIFTGGGQTFHTPQHHSLPIITPKPAQANDMIFFGNEVKSLSELPLETLLKIKKHLEEMTSGITHSQATAANAVYPVYEHPHTSKGALSSGYLNVGGGTFAHGSGYGNEETNVEFNSGEVIKFTDQGKTEYEQGVAAHGFITPQPFIHKFKKKHAAEPWNEKPSKIQTIFQVSVTALSFLAFGGYLLCLILAALKAKGTAFYPAKGQLMANQLNNNKRPVQNSPVVIRPNANRRPSYGRRRRKRSTKNNDDDKGKTIKNGIYHENFTMEDGNLPFNHEEMYHALISIAEGYVKFNDFYHK